MLHDRMDAALASAKEKQTSPTQFSLLDIDWAVFLAVTHPDTREVSGRPYSRAYRGVAVVCADNAASRSLLHVQGNATYNGPITL